MPELDISQFKPDPQKHPYLAKLVSALGGPQVPIPALGSVAPKAVIGAVGAIPKAVGLLGGELSSANPDNLSYIADIAKSSLPKSPQMVKSIADTIQHDLTSGMAQPTTTAGTMVSEKSTLMKLIDLLASHYYGSGGVENK